ncbi:MAG: carbohydrate binding domain-containing protein [Polyangiaceae bacterium]
MRLPSSYPSSSLILLLALSACGGSTTTGGHRVGGASRSESETPGDPAHNLLKNRDFESGSMLPWLTSFSPPAEGEGLVKKGALCINVKQGGSNRWDAQVRHREMVIQQGHEYVVSFKAWASRPTKVAGKIGMSGPPYTDYWTKQLDLTEEPKQFAYKFKMSRPDDATAEFALHFGGTHDPRERPHRPLLRRLRVVGSRLRATATTEGCGNPEVARQSIGICPFVREICRIRQ